MREFKFRCWDAVRYGMQYFDGLEEIVNFYRYHKFQYEMQYTGLTDKNGKEIYEGDIVEYRLYKQSKKDKSRIRTTIEIDNLIDGMSEFQYDGYSNSNVDFSSVEVIGNIYENPALLGESKDEQTD